MHKSTRRFRVTFCYVDRHKSCFRGNQRDEKSAENIKKNETKNKIRLLGQKHNCDNFIKIISKSSQLDSIFSTRETCDLQTRMSMTEVYFFHAIPTAGEFVS